MELSSIREEDCVYFKIEGYVDEQGAEELRSHFSELDVSALSEVVFDFQDVNRIGSAGIGQILLLYKKIAANGGTIRIEQVSNNLFDLFKVLKLNTLFTINKA